MTAKLDYKWKLREVMATRGLFQTTHLRPELAERGIHLSDSQVYRLVTDKPERLNLKIFMALLDILGCRMDDLIEPGRPARGENEEQGRRPQRPAAGIRDRRVPAQAGADRSWPLLVTGSGAAGDGGFGSEPAAGEEPPSRAPSAGTPGRSHSATSTDIRAAPAAAPAAAPSLSPGS